MPHIHLITLISAQPAETPLTICIIYYSLKFSSRL